MNDCNDSLGKTHMLIALEALWGYLQVLIKVEDKDKTATTSYLGTDRYSRTLVCSSPYEMHLQGSCVRWTLSYLESHRIFFSFI